MSWDAVSDRRGIVSTLAEDRRVPTRFPERDRRFGPATARRLRRTLALYVIVVACAVVPFVIDTSPAWKAFGIGLLWPGAGLLFTAGVGNLAIGIALLALVLVLFTAAFVLWWGTGNILAPIAIWLGAAGAASLLTSGGGNDWALPVALGVVAVIVVRAEIRQRRGLRAARATAREHNEKLATLELTGLPRFVATEPYVGPELTEDDLAFLRWFVDMGLQPVDQFEGFVFIDQFQPAAVRYQINMIGWALSLAHYSRTPAFHGYMARAQRNLIEKTLVRDVWKYWRLENLWGNLRYNPDPIPRDNVMLSGYFGMQVGMYESVTNDHRFDQPGALTFRWNDHTAYEHSHTTINEAVAGELERYAFGAFPCEPNWIYTICNEFGMTSLILYDRLHGTTFAEEAADGMRRALELEMVGGDGRAIGVKSTRLGCAVAAPGLISSWGRLATSPPYAAPFTSSRELFDGRRGGSLGGETGVGGFDMTLAAIFPDLVERNMAVGSYEMMRDAFVGGLVDVHSMSGGPMFDPGFYRKVTGNPPYLMIMGVARELGDEELFKVLLEALDTDPNVVVANEGGVKRYPNMSALMASMTMQSRFSRQGGYFDLINRGNRPEWDHGPLLASAPYPEVLVARAETDGRTLDLVLRPGDRPGRFAIEVQRLIPGQRYQVRGAVDDHLVADARGASVLEVTLDGRLEVHIAPGV
jgi:hypothetical protein